MLVFPRMAAERITLAALGSTKRPLLGTIARATSGYKWVRPQLLWSPRAHSVRAANVSGSGGRTQAHPHSVQDGSYSRGIQSFT